VPVPDGRPPRRAGDCGVAAATVAAAARLLVALVAVAKVAGDWLPCTEVCGTAEKHSSAVTRVIVSDDRPVWSTAPGTAEACSSRETIEVTGTVEDCPLRPDRPEIVGGKSKTITGAVSATEAEREGATAPTLSSCAW